MKPFLNRSPVGRLWGPLLIAALTLTSATPSPAQTSAEAFVSALKAVSADRIFADVRALSHPSFNGRQAGTEDDLRSAAWVEDQFRSAGLSLAAVGDRSSGGSDAALNRPGLMTAPLSTVTIGQEPILDMGAAGSMLRKRSGTDYLPILDSPAADLQAPVVFVGYGTRADYADVDVKNCIVLFLRGKPEHATKPLSHAEKVRLARDNGAVGYLTATGPVLSPYEARRGVTGAPSAFYSQMAPAEAIPGAWISTQVAEEVFDGRGEARGGRLRELQQLLNGTSSPRSVRTGYHALLQWQTSVREGVLTNVVAVLPGTGPDTVVIGAHRDHFGRTAGLLFPGADDNASGTAVILEVARALAESGWRLKRTLLFVSFSGEERDLLGSRLYISRPTVPLSSTTAMVNVDHAGVGNGRLTVGVAGLDKSLVQNAGALAGLGERLDLYGFFPGGDHVPFKEAGIPTVTVVSGGIHPHFHQPTDTAETIDPAILKTAAQYVLTVTWQLGNQP